MFKSFKADKVDDDEDDLCHKRGSENVFILFTARISFNENTRERMLTINDETC